MQKAIKNYIRVIRIINEIVGNLVMVLPIAITLLAAVEVLLRYIFKSPTIWIWEFNTQLFAAMVMLGGGYTLLHGAHISVDFLTMALPSRKKAVVDLLTAPVFFLSILAITYFGWIIAWESWLMKETNATLWGSPIYTLRMTIPIGGLLMLLQGIAKYLADILFLITGERIALNE
jgi:TRAP-type mannitol/chloroaromatic compound transport system permease small subunit